MPKETDPVSITELYDAFKESLGLEGAYKVVDDAIAELQLEKKTEYPQADALRICQVLQKQSGYIGIFAGYLAARLVLRKATKTS